MDLVFGGASSEANGTSEEASEKDIELKRVSIEGGARSVRKRIVENETRVAAADELVTDHEEYVVVGALDVQNSVATRTRLSVM